MGRRRGHQQHPPAERALSHAEARDGISDPAWNRRKLHLPADAPEICGGVEEVMSHPIGYLDGLSNADRENRFYRCYYSPASDDGGHVSVRGLPRIFVRRRNLQIFTSNADAARTSALLIDPKLTSTGRRARLAAALWPGSRRQARMADAGSDVSGEP